jgi:class 3 adenylate cyclase
MQTLTGHYFILVLDIEGFSIRTDPVQRTLRRAMYEVARAAVTDAYLSWEGFLRQDRGDGIIMLFPSGVSPVTLAGDLIRTLNARLAEMATVPDAQHRMRFRVALHHGLANKDAEGWSGNAVNTACRLVDAQPLRDALKAAPDAHLALIVSDVFHQAVIRPGHRSTDGATFAPVRVDVKELIAYRSWIRVPGYPAPPRLSGGEFTLAGALGAQPGEGV